jgi:hypothetical protein
VTAIGRRVAWALPMLLAACATTPISLRQGPRAFTERDYEDVYEAWTRSEQDFSFSRMSDVLRVSATFESWEFRWAYVVRYAHDYSLETAARDEMLRTTLADSRRHHRFFVTLVGQSYREADLSGPSSAWRVLLVDEEGRQTPPQEIERIRRPSAAERVYFPSVNHHRQTFRIMFPAVRDDGLPSIPPDAERIVLLFTGPRGRVELEWKIDLEDGAGED